MALNDQTGPHVDYVCVHSTLAALIITHSMLSDLTGPQIQLVTRCYSLTS